MSYFPLLQKVDYKPYEEEFIDWELAPIEILKLIIRYYDGYIELYFTKNPYPLRDLLQSIRISIYSESDIKKTKN